MGVALEGGDRLSLIADDVIDWPDVPPGAKAPRLPVFVIYLMCLCPAYTCVGDRETYIYLISYTVFIVDSDVKNESLLKVRGKMNHYFVR